MLTADTITDDQIRELRDRLFERAIGGADVTKDMQACSSALGDPSYTGESRPNARARCAEILNAREGVPLVLTAATITDEQVKSVWSLGDNSITGRELMNALSEPLPSGEFPSPDEVKAARERCVEILNTRAKESR